MHNEKKHKLTKWILQFIIIWIVSMFLIKISKPNIIISMLIGLLSTTFLAMIDMCISIPESLYTH